MTEISIFFLAIEKPGGLFDFDGTLPLIAVQFLGLMFLLNIILYTPLLNVINDRNQYIDKNYTSAKTIEDQSKLLKAQYKDQLAAARKTARVQYGKVQNLCTTARANEKKVSQKFLKDVTEKADKILEAKRAEVRSILDSEVDSLSTLILSKVLPN